MTVREFINRFDEKDLDKELYFEYSIMVARPKNNGYIANARKFNKIMKDETGSPYFSDEFANKDNLVVVELGN